MRGYCQWCGAELPPRMKRPWAITSKNKVRKWCSNNCRQKAWWAKQTPEYRKRKAKEYRDRHTQGVGYEDREQLNGIDW